MTRNRYSPEQIIGYLREAEVTFSKGSRLSDLSEDRAAAPPRRITVGIKSTLV